jgi:hypothetical protein
MWSSSIGIKSKVCEVLTNVATSQQGSVETSPLHELGMISLEYTLASPRRQTLETTQMPPSDADLEQYA